MTPGERCVLTLSCPDVPGIVHAVSGFLVEQGCTIATSQQFGDRDSAGFFMRVEFARADGERLDAARLRAAMTPVAARFAMSWRLVDAAEKARVLIMVSRFGHCLDDLVFR
jgi:formyltetrahydrofolate deformylase